MLMASLHLCYTIHIVEKLTFDDYFEHAKSTAYFLAEPDLDKQRQIVDFGFTEEVNELLTDNELQSELRDVFWGRDVPAEVKDQLRTEKTSEAGDVLYFVAASCMLRQIPFNQISTRAIRLFTGNENFNSYGTFEEFDDVMQDRMVSEVPPDYHPDYFAMQFWNLSPFDEEQSGDDSFDGLGFVNKGPLVLDYDGLFALERLSRNCGAFLTGDLEEWSIRDSALMLGALSAVLQNRFDSSLEEAAEVNIVKRDRRARANAVLSGEDEERKRPNGKPRPDLNGWDSTVLNLIYGVNAD